MSASGIPAGTPDPDFPWVTLLDRLLGRRCRAVREPRGPFSHFGRCEFRVHNVNLDHCLERGMFNIRWTTRDTDRAHNG